MRKVGIDGQIYWDAPKNLTNDPSSDNFVRKVFNLSDGGAFVVLDQIGSGNFDAKSVSDPSGIDISPDFHLVTILP